MSRIAASFIVLALISSTETAAQSGYYDEDLAGGWELSSSPIDTTVTKTSSDPLGILQVGCSNSNSGKFPREFWVSYQFAELPHRQLGSTPLIITFDGSRNHTFVASDQHGNGYMNLGVRGFSNQFVRDVRQSNVMETKITKGGRSYELRFDLGGSTNAVNNLTRFCPSYKTVSSKAQIPAPPKVQATPRVRRVQEVLFDHGCYAGEVDGIISPETTEAIVRFQIDRDIWPQDGKLDNETFGAIVSSTLATEICVSTKIEQ